MANLSKGSLTVVISLLSLQRFKKKKKKRNSHSDRLAVGNLALISELICSLSFYVPYGKPPLYERSFKSKT